METTETAEKPKVRQDKHITIRGKPICRCHFSKEQFVKLVNLIQDRWSCTYDNNDPRLQLVYESVRSVVKDPTTVEIKDGPCVQAGQAGPGPFLSMMTVPPGTSKEKLVEMLAAQMAAQMPGVPGAPSHNRMGLPGSGSHSPPPPSDAGSDDSDSFAA